MAVMAGAFVLRNSSVTFEGVEYANQLNKARLVPDTPIQTLRTLDPSGTLQDVDSASWNFEIAGPQAWAATGLAKFLNDNAGNEIDIVFSAKKGTGLPKATFVVIAVPVEYGGTQGAFNSFEVTLPVQGSPVWGVNA